MNISATLEEKSQPHANDPFSSSSSTVAMNESSDGDVNITEGDDDHHADPGEDLSKSVRYSVIVPILMACCLITFCMNAYIIAAFPLIRNLSKARLK